MGECPKIKCDDKPKVSFPTVTFSGQHKELFERAVGAEVGAEDEIVAKVKFRVCGIHSSTSKNSNYDNRIECEIVSMDGAGDKTKMKEKVEEDDDSDGESFEAEETVEASPAGRY